VHAHLGLWPSFSERRLLTDYQEQGGVGIRLSGTTIGESKTSSRPPAVAQRVKRW